MSRNSNVVGMDILRQQVFEVSLGLNQRKFFKNMPQVTVGLKAVGLGGLDQSEKGGTGYGTIRAAGKQPVLSAHHKGADGILDPVVVRS